MMKNAYNVLRSKASHASALKSAEVNPFDMRHFVYDGSIDSYTQPMWMKDNKTGKLNLTRGNVLDRNGDFIKNGKYSNKGIII